MSIRDTSLKTFAQFYKVVVRLSLSVLGVVNAEQFYTRTATGGAPGAGKINATDYQINGSTVVAVQSDMETATSNTKFATPGTTKFHPGVAKAWVAFTYVSGTPTIQTNFNVSSLTDNAVGDTTINFSTAFSSVNYVAVGGADGAGAVNGNASGRAVGSYRGITNNGASNVDVNTGWVFWGAI